MERNRERESERLRSCTAVHKTKLSDPICVFAWKNEVNGVCLHLRPGSEWGVCGCAAFCMSWKPSPSRQPFQVRCQPTYSFILFSKRTVASAPRCLLAFSRQDGGSPMSVCMHLCVCVCKRVSVCINIHIHIHVRARIYMPT